jgi:hypothetical protein
VFFFSFLFENNSPVFESDFSQTSAPLSAPRARRVRIYILRLSKQNYCFKLSRVAPMTKVDTQINLLSLATLMALHTHARPFRRYRRGDEQKKKPTVLFRLICVYPRTLIYTYYGYDETNICMPKNNVRPGSIFYAAFTSWVHTSTAPVESVQKKKKKNISLLVFTDQARPFIYFLSL